MFIIKVGKASKPNLSSFSAPDKSFRKFRFESFQQSVALVLTTKLTTAKTLHTNIKKLILTQTKLECGPMPNVMDALPNIGGALCSTPQTFANAHY